MAKIELSELEEKLVTQLRKIQDGYGVTDGVVRKALEAIKDEYLKMSFERMWRQIELSEPEESLITQLREIKNKYGCGLTERVVHTALSAVWDDDWLREDIIKVPKEIYDKGYEACADWYHGPIDEDDLPQPGSAEYDMMMHPDDYKTPYDEEAFNNGLIEPEYGGYEFVPDFAEDNGMKKSDK